MQDQKMSLADKWRVTPLPNKIVLGFFGFACIASLISIANSPAPSTSQSQGSGYAASNASVSQPSGTMSLDDFKLDYKNLRNQTVSLSGRLIMQGEMLMLMSGLYNGLMNSDFVILEWEHLPRDQRKELVNQCRSPGCTAIVRGRVTDVMLNKGLRLESVSLR